MKAFLVLCGLVASAAAVTDLKMALKLADDDSMTDPLMLPDIPYFETTSNLEEAEMARQLTFSFEADKTEVVPSVTVTFDGTPVVVFTDAGTDTYDISSAVPHVPQLPDLLPILPGEITGYLRYTIDESAPANRQTKSFVGDLIMSAPTLDYEGTWEVSVTADGAGNSAAVDASPVGFKKCINWKIDMEADVAECQIKGRVACGDADDYTESEVKDENTLYPAPYSATVTVSTDDGEVLSEQDATDFEPPVTGTDGISFNWRSEIVTLGITTDSPKGAIKAAFNVKHSYTGMAPPPAANQFPDGYDDVDADDVMFTQFDTPGCLDFTTYCNDPANSALPNVPDGLSLTLDPNTACAIITEDQDNFEPTTDTCRNEIRPKTGVDAIRLAFKCKESCRLVKFVDEPVNESDDEGVGTDDYSAKNLVCKAGGKEWEEDTQEGLVGRWPQCDCDDDGGDGDGDDGASSMSLSLALVAVTAIVARAF